GRQRARRHRGRHAAPAQEGRPRRGLPTGQRPRQLPVHEDDHAGGTAPVAARRRRRGARRPRRRQPCPRRRRADDRHRPTRRWRVTLTLAPVDLLVVGSGVAGLTAVLEARSLGLRTLMVTKGDLPDGSTRWAQGGISVVLDDEAADPGDTVEAHVADTVVAGAGLCDEYAVRTILADGSAVVRRLRQRGAVFDVAPAGGLARGREGGHSAFRVIHAGGDATGAEVERALVEAARADQTAILAHHTVVALCRDERGVTGAELVAAYGDGVVVPAGAVLLATGGVGHLYASTTTPPVATGEGLA